MSALLLWLGLWGCGRGEAPSTTPRVGRRAGLGGGLGRDLLIDQDAGGGVVGQTARAVEGSRGVTVRVTFTPRAWMDYTNWITTNAKIAGKINSLIHDIRRTPFKGLGKPEPLRGDRTGMWSRRITDEHRLLYRVEGLREDQRVEIVQCRLHS